MEPMELLSMMFLWLKSNNIVTIGIKVLIVSFMINLI